MAAFEILRRVAEGAYASVLLAAKEEELKLARRQLEKLEAARKVLEGA